MLNLLLGDFRFFWPENIKFFAHVPYAWDSSLNTGIGISSINTIWITSFLNLTSFFSYLGIPWFIINLVFWIIPALLIAFLGAFFLFRNIISKNIVYSLLSGIIFTTNTYFLTIFLGGQQGVAFAYALMPLVFLTFINLLRNTNLRSSIIFSLALSLQLLFDPRFFLLTLGSLFFYSLLQSEFFKKHLLYVVITPLLIVFLLHSYWIIPLILFKPAFLPQGFDSLSGLKFFSFALFENTISLLHPNWPENIFGKTYFMRPEFLIIPILAFVSLFFIDLKNKKEILQSRVILFFALLGLAGVFLAKGTNEPFGRVFEWLFENIPGFSLFRDPTKFYSLIALSYSILIPYSLFNFSVFLKRKISHKILIGAFLIFWIFSLRLIFISDIFQIRKVPESYVRLKDFIVEQNEFFRTLWIPEWQRYGYFSDINPAIGRYELLKSGSASAMIQELNMEESQELFSNLSVRYVIVPQDSEGEIFLSDRKYDDQKYKDAVNGLEEIPWLKKVETFGKIVVFEAPDFKDRFWSPNDNLQIDYKFINPTRYKLNIKNAEINERIVFAEGYDQNWIAKSSNLNVSSSEFNKMNSFVLQKTGNYVLEIYYGPQKWVHIGLVISSITLALIIMSLARSKLKK